MVDVSRRQAIIAAGGATVVAAGGVTVISGGGDNNDVNTDDSTDSNTGDSAGAIQNLTTERQDSSGRLALTLREGAASRVAMLSDGTEVETSRVAAAETTAYLDLSELSYGDYEVVLYGDNGDVVDETTWSPTVDVSVTGASKSTEFGEKAGLRIELTNQGDLPVLPSGLYVSDGYPTETHDGDTAGEVVVNPTEEIPPAGGSNTYTIRAPDAPYNNSIRGILSPPNNECSGKSHTLEATIEFTEIDPITTTMDVTLDGNLEESNHLKGVEYCSDTQIDLS